MMNRHSGDLTRGFNNFSFLLNKLVSYSALSTIFIGFANDAEGQIIYTNIDPDSIYDDNGDIFKLDLNGDLVIDLEIRKAFFTNYFPEFETTSGGIFPASQTMNHIYATPLFGNALAGEFTPYGFSYPFALEEGDTICHDQNWLTGQSQILVYSLFYHIETAPDVFLDTNYNSDGLWFGGQTDKYLGIRFRNGIDTLYGWVRLDVAADNIAFTVKDYGYNAQAGGCILAGEPNIDTLDIIEPWQLKDISAYSFENCITVYTSDASLINADVELFSMAGQMVFAGNLKFTTQKFILQNIPNGIYMLKVSSVKGSYTNKLYLHQEY